MKICWTLQSNLTPLPRQTFVPGIGEGAARCPYDPDDNSTAIWVESGNPDNLPGLYRYTCYSIVQRVLNYGSSHNEYTCTVYYFPVLWG